MTQPKLNFDYGSSICDFYKILFITLSSIANIMVTDMAPKMATSGIKFMINTWVLSKGFSNNIKNTLILQISEQVIDYNKGLS